MPFYAPACFGRLAGSEGNVKAQDYIAQQFEAAGLVPLTGYESYLQPYTQDVFDQQAQTQVLTARYGDGSSRTFRSGVDFYPYLYVGGGFSGTVALTDETYGGNPFFLVQSDGGEEVKIVNTDKRPVRLYYGETAPALNCGDALYEALKDAEYITLDGAPQVREATVNNVVGVLPGANRTEAILVSAHFDHAGGYGGLYYPGALDNASGVAALLEIVRSLEGEQPAIDLIFVAFNGEEMSQQGSTAFAAGKLPYEKLNAINLDVVGTAGTAELFLSGDAPLGQAIIDFWTVKALATAVFGEDTGNTDHLPLNYAGIPAVTVSSNMTAEDMNQMTHVPTDTVDGLDPVQIGAVSQAVLSYITAQQTIELTESSVKPVYAEPDPINMDLVYDRAQEVLLRLRPDWDEMVLIELDGQVFLVQDTTCFLSPAELRVSRPGTQIPPRLGAFELIESELNHVGRALPLEDGTWLGITAFQFIELGGYQFGQVYPLPEQYRQKLYYLNYQQGSKTLYLQVYDRNYQSIASLTEAWERTETRAIGGGTLYVQYQTLDGTEYLRGVLYSHPDLPGYLKAVKRDLLTEISLDEMIGAVVSPLEDLKKLPDLFSTQHGGQAANQTP